MLENGLCKPKNLEGGMTGVVGRAIVQSCFAMEIRGSARHLSGDKGYSREREERVSANKLGCQFSRGG